MAIPEPPTGKGTGDKLPRVTFQDLNEVIALANENAEFKRNIGDLLLLLHKRNEDKLHDCMRNKDKTFSWCYDQVCELIVENKKLKAEPKQATVQDAFEAFKYNCLCARATLFPGKSIDEVHALINSQRETFNKE